MVLGVNQDAIEEQENQMTITDNSGSSGSSNPFLSGNLGVNDEAIEKLKNGNATEKMREEAEKLKDNPIYKGTKKLAENPKEALENIQDDNTDFENPVDEGPDWQDVATDTALQTVGNSLFPGAGGAIGSGIGSGTGDQTDNIVDNQTDNVQDTVDNVVETTKETVKETVQVPQVQMPEWPGDGIMANIRQFLTGFTLTAIGVVVATILALRYIAEIRTGGGN